MYLAEHTHEAIIDPETFELVQDEMSRREREKRTSGRTIFSAKIKCGDCGGWYGSKVWYSTDEYKKVIWQCGHKFKGKEHCRTPHLTEDEIKEVFVKAMNQVISEKDEIIGNLKELLKESVSEKETGLEQKEAAAQMRYYADALDAENLRNTEMLQDQEEYRRRVKELQRSFDAAKEKYDEAGEKLRAETVKRKGIKGMIRELEKRDEVLEKFDEGLWSRLVDYMTVDRDGKVRVKFRSGVIVTI